MSVLAALAFALAGDSIPAIVPRPAHVTVQPGAFTLRAGTVIVTDRALRELGERLSDYVFPATGLRLAVRTGGGGAPTGSPVISIRLDSSLDVLVIAPVMTNLKARGGGDKYAKAPKGNVDVTGQYFIWTDNMSSDRLDAFVVKVPAQLLTNP